MARLTIEELIAAFKELTLVELSEFVKASEEGLSVAAAAPVATVVTTPAAGGEAAATEGGKDSFGVILGITGNKKVAAIREVRILVSLDLKEAKGLVDSAPKTVLEGINKEATNKTRKQLRSTDTSVTVR